jgi:hypothetical protein
MDVHIRRNKEILYADIAGDTVMMNVEQGEYYGLDAIGTRIWRLLEHDVRIEEICTLLGNEYEVSDTQCRDDILCFLQELLEHHIIEVR